LVGWLVGWLVIKFIWPRSFVAYGRVVVPKNARVNW